MNKKRAFLEKGMRDRRFRKSEDAILKVFSEQRGSGLTMVKMAKKSGFGRTTMYKHHHALREVIPDYQRYMLLEYDRIIRKKVRRKNAQLKMLYVEMLVFIARNRKVYKMFLKFGHREIFLKMLGRLRTKIENVMHLPKNSEKIFRIYASDVTELILAWGEKGFPEDEIERVLADIMYLTETSRDRLMPINY